MPPIAARASSGADMMSAAPNPSSSAAASSAAAAATAKMPRRRSFSTPNGNGNGNGSGSGSGSGKDSSGSGNGNGVHANTNGVHSSGTDAAASSRARPSLLERRENELAALQVPRTQRLHASPRGSFDSLASDTATTHAHASAAASTATAATATAATAGSPLPASPSPLSAAEASPSHFHLPSIGNAAGSPSHGGARSGSGMGFGGATTPPPPAAAPPSASSSGGRRSPRPPPAAAASPIPIAGPLSAAPAPPRRRSIRRASSSGSALASTPPEGGNAAAAALAAGAMRPRRGSFGRHFLDEGSPPAYEADDGASPPRAPPPRLRSGPTVPPHRRASDNVVFVSGGDEDTEAEDEDLMAAVRQRASATPRSPLAQTADGAPRGLHVHAPEAERARAGQTPPQHSLQLDDADGANSVAAVPPAASPTRRDLASHLSDYTLEKTVGEGAFAKVKLATHTLSGIQVAIKIIYKDRIKEEYVRRNLQREGDLMRALHHQHVIRLYEVIETGVWVGGVGMGEWPGGVGENRDEKARQIAWQQAYLNFSHHPTQTMCTPW